MSPLMLRNLTLFFDSVIPGFPISSFWLDYFAVNRTCAVDSLPRIFGLMPARFTYRLDYLVRKRWYQRAWDSIAGTSRTLFNLIRETLRSARTPR
jgi:hypothetical protein